MRSAPSSTKSSTRKGMKAMANPTAQWSLSLNTDCPSCDEWVDLLDYSDFWDGRKLAICENGTDLSRDVEVVCPECGHEFNVDLEY